MVIPQAEGTVQGGLYALDVEVLEDIAVALGRGAGGVVVVEHGVHQPADGPHHGHGAVAQGDHLDQSAGLEQAGDHDHVGPGIDQVGQLLVEAELEVAVRIVVEQVFEVPELLVDPGLRGRPQEHELGVMLEGVEQGVADSV